MVMGVRNLVTTVKSDPWAASFWYLKKCSFFSKLHLFGTSTTFSFYIEEIFLRLTCNRRCPLF
jgi:hypothetical protein